MSFGAIHSDLKAVYEQLKDRYELTLTNTSSLDEGFTEDLPILVGRAHGHIIWLYMDGDEFVLDVTDNNQTKGTHWHPYDVAAAAEDFSEFMEGKIEYKLSQFRNQ